MARTPMPASDDAGLIAGNRQWRPGMVRRSGSFAKVGFFRHYLKECEQKSEARKMFY